MADLASLVAVVVRTSTWWWCVCVVALAFFGGRGGELALFPWWLGALTGVRGLMSSERVLEDGVPRRVRMFGGLLGKVERMLVK